MSSQALPHRRLGELSVSLVGLGCNNFGGRLDLERTRAVVDTALEAGIDFLDTADVYGGRGGSETLLGEVLKGRREEVVLATKFGMDMGDANGAPAGPRGSRPYIRQAVEASLRRLQIEAIDLYQYHAPDGVTPLPETMGALQELVQEGKIRAYGCSNFSAPALLDADRVAREEGLEGFVSLQNRYSLLERDIEADVLPACERLGVGVLPYYPLASGLLTGKYRRGERAPAGTRLQGREIADERTFSRLEALEELARRHGVELIDVAIGTLAARPAIASVIAGATRPEQVRANAAALRFAPDPADLAEIDAIAPVPGA